MSSKPRILFFLVVASVIAGTFSCAKVGQITGGEKDIAPPVVVKAEPANYSTGFDKSKIVISFNEFIELKDIRQEFVISPPVDPSPDIKLKGKNLEISLDRDSLLENTTYTLNFGNAITDYTEGNPLQNFEYVFSTGEHIDSLSVRGQVLMAFTLEPPKDPLHVMLYGNLNDSAPMLEKPSFISRTASQGFFAINNLPPGTFRLFALKDANNNLLFDQPTEPLAFLDTTIQLSSSMFKPKPVVEEKDTSVADSLVIRPPDMDSLRLLNDTLMLDSLYGNSRFSYALYTDLYLFEQDVYNQYISDYVRPDDRRIRLVFKEPLSKPVNIYLTDTTVEGTWYITEKYVIGDTIDYWITDSSLYKMEQLKVGIGYYKTDSTGELSFTTDTLSFSFKEKKKPSGRKKDDEEVPTEEHLNSLKVNAGSGKFGLNSHLVIESTYPADTVKKDLIQLYTMQDSIKKPVAFSLEKDSFKLRRYHIYFKPLESTKYNFVIYTGAFDDIYGNSHDTTDISFVTRTRDSYGKLFVSIQNDAIIQLMQKDKVVYEKTGQAGEKAVFDFIEPKTYRLKVIFDRNNNGKWDTGNYLEGIQPEKVWFHDKEVEVKAGWDLELELNIEE